MIVNDLLVKGTGRFVDNVYASEFVGDLDGNAETSTYATYVKQNSSNASYGRPILLAYQESPVDGTASNVYYDSAVTVNPSTNTITADTFKGNLTGTATAATDASYAGTLRGQPSLGSSSAMDSFLNTNGVQYAVFTSDSSGLFNGNDGMLLSLPWIGNINFGAQLAFDDSTNGTVYVRGKANSWGSWYKLLHSGNYTDYAATKEHTHTAISNDLKIEGMLEHKSTKFSSYTRQVQPEECAGGSWWRIYSNSSGNGNGKGSSIFTLGRSYWSPQNEEYVFSVNVGYDGDINIVQLSGVIGGHLIKKIRVVYKNSSTYYIDFYTDPSDYPNSYYVHGMGYGNYQTPTLVSSIEEGYSTYEFITVNGCKSDKGFTGDFYGISSQAVTLQNLTASVAELNYCDGVTSNIQTQLNSKVNKTATGATDLNTITDSGFYRLNNGHTNIPTGGEWGQLLVMHGGADTITQIVGSYSSSELYTRSGNPTDVGGSGTWKEWRTLIDSSNYASYITPAGIGASKVKIVRW